MTGHLELMSKPRLIAIIHGAEARAQQNADLAAYWRGVVNQLIETRPTPPPEWSPERVWSEAARILRSLPPDPHAQEHRETLLAATYVGTGHGPEREPGPRCERIGCSRRLNDAGMCSRCDWYQIRLARRAVA